MLNINQFRELIVKPALNLIQQWSKNAEEIIVFTCAVESLGGTYLKQLKGPALGIYQMEPNTHNDIWENYIKNQQSLSLMLNTNFHINRIPDEERMVYDLRYATVMVRLHYLRVKEALPFYNDQKALWNYYKKYYNTENGKADRVTSLIKYNNFIHSSLDNS